tara:strand:+ start:1111 stop:1572 length:462 start_codon:yes stop_codon:yes gene_type:complete
MKIFLLFLIITLSSCSSVYYKKEGWVPEGYFDEKIAEAEYLVSFQTYRKLDWPVIEGYALLRAAELGKLNNYKYFSTVNYKQDEFIESQQNNEVSGLITRETTEGAASVLGTVIPSFTSEHKIRTVSFKAIYENELGSNGYEVDVILADNEGQ